MDPLTRRATIGRQQYAVASVGGVLRCPCHVSTTQPAASGLGYWCYLGFRPRGEIIRYVRVGVSSAGSGAQTAEVAVFTSATPPTGAVITLTKLWADGTVDALTATGAKGNTTANTVPLPADSHVWAGFRSAMATTQPTLHILTRDWGAGLLASDYVAALTGLTTTTVTPVTFAGATSPDIRGYL